MKIKREFKFGDGSVAWIMHQGTVWIWQLNHEPSVPVRGWSGTMKSARLQAFSAYRKQPAAIAGEGGK